MPTFPSRFTTSRRASGIVVFFALAAVLSSPGQAGQSRAVSDRVYSDAQAARGQQFYKAQCVTCHGEALEGVVGPPLAGAGFLSAWGTRSLADLVDKIEKTMPPQAAGSMSRPQAIDLAAFLLRAGKFPAGQTDLEPAVLAQITFPAAQAAAGAGAVSSFAVAGNLAQLMRGVTFPNANILFNVQVKDPGKDKPAMPIPFDYVQWGATVYYGWQVSRSGRACARRDRAALPVAGTTLRERQAGSRRSRRLEAVHRRADGRRSRGLQGGADAQRRRRRQGGRSTQRVVRELPQGVSRRHARGKHGRRQQVPVMREIM